MGVEDATVAHVPSPFRYFVRSAIAGAGTKPSTPAAVAVAPVIAVAVAGVKASRAFSAVLTL
jgi:hypothetical protein